jgi:hypothetical protein
MKNDKPALEWDECKIAEEEARYRQTAEWFDRLEPAASHGALAPVDKVGFS